jgi:hypothetical protein
MDVSKSAIDLFPVQSKSLPLQSIFFRVHDWSGIVQSIILSLHSIYRVCNVCSWPGNVYKNCSGLSISSALNVSGFTKDLIFRSLLSRYSQLFLFYCSLSSIIFPVESISIPLGTGFLYRYAREQPLSTQIYSRPASFSRSSHRFNNGPGSSEKL